MVWELAGIVGVAPGQLTLRELAWMAEGRVAENWRHTAELLAMLYNIHRDPKRTRPLTADDFNPCVLAKRKARQPMLRARGISVLRDVFVRDTHAQKGAS